MAHLDDLGGDFACVWAAGRPWILVPGRLRLGHLEKPPTLRSKFIDLIIGHGELHEKLTFVDGNLGRHCEHLKPEPSPPPDLTDELAQLAIDPDPAALAARLPDTHRELRSRAKIGISV